MELINLPFWPWEQGKKPISVNEKGEWYEDELLSRECIRETLNSTPMLRAKVAVFRSYDDTIRDYVLLGSRNKGETFIIFSTPGMTTMATRIDMYRLDLAFSQKEEDPIDWQEFMKSEFTLWEDYKHTKRGSITSRKFGF